MDEILFNTERRREQPAPQDTETFDMFAAREARDEALDRVEEHAPAGWNERALQAVRELCEVRQRFIADDIWLTGLERPEEARALGAVMRTAQREGVCAPTAEFRTSAQPQCHGNPRRVWRSMIYTERRGAA